MTLPMLAGVRHVGTFRTSAERRRPVVLTPKQARRSGSASPSPGANGDYRVTRATYVPTYWDPVTAGRPIRIQRVDRALSHGAADRARLLEARRMVRPAVSGLQKSGRTTPGLRER